MPEPTSIALRPIAARVRPEGEAPPVHRVADPGRESATVQPAGERRVLATIDVLSANDVLDPDALVLSRAHAATRFRLELAELKDQVELVRRLVVPVRFVPQQLVGHISQPNGATAERLQIEIDINSTTRRHRASTFVDSDGMFRLLVPARTPFPAEGLRLTVRGGNGRTEVAVGSADVADNGLIGDLQLTTTLTPLPKSIVASLLDLLPQHGYEAEGQRPPVVADFPDLTIGECGTCQSIYRSNASFDRFSYGVFVRLVEPRTSVAVPTLRFPLPGTDRTIPITGWSTSGFNANLPITYVDRVPVDQPISVDGFRDQLVGVGNGTVVQGAETVPMAATLGLGYVLRMTQRWTPKGLSLGDLVYSLPLAPGEQQRVAIFERRETTFVTEDETFSADEQQRFREDTDASTEAVFTSAFNESARGGSRFESTSENSSSGWTAIVYSSGGGSSTSSGNNSSWMEGHRDTVATASQEVHTAVERQASARRRLARTAMRLASSFESAEVTTKTITNHNHTRALTMQYWEVMRLFEVTSAVEGVTLVCLVPLQVVRFLPVGQPLTLGTTAIVDERHEILNRYALVLKHADVLERRLPRKYRHGLNLLRQFAADPTATFKTAGGAAQDVIHVSIQGSFLPFEQIFVSVVTRSGSRVGPVELGGLIPEIPGALGAPGEAFATRDELIGELRARRNGMQHTLTGDIALPQSLPRNDVIGFEVTRRFRRFDYRLVNQQFQVRKLLGLAITLENAPDALTSGSVSLTPQDLERLVGGPEVSTFSASIHDINNADSQTLAEGYMTSSHELPAAGLPIPARELGPVLRYSQLLEIERMLQHVVNNTMRYSIEVWKSLSSEERVVMLEGYTIGVPPGGIEDETQNIPLLNCVENRVLGYYGNSMIMPFNIPKGVVDDLDISNADVQDALAEFHTKAFASPVSVVALPTRGVLGEAVLGHCPSAEKIDLTRFWNWQDSPADSAPNIADVTLPTDKQVTTALRAPNDLAGVAPLINNINANPVAPGADGGLAQAIGAAVLAQKGFDVASLTNAGTLGSLILGDQKVADQARANALETTKQLTGEALAIVGNIVGGMKAGNPTAGTSAAQAVFGGKVDEGKKDEKKEDKKDDKKKEEEKPEEDEGGGGGGGGENS